MSKKNLFELYQKSVEGTEIPSKFRAFGAYILASSMIARNVVLDRRTMVLYGNLYILLVSSQGKAKKSVFLENLKSYLTLTDRSQALMPDDVTPSKLLSILKNRDTLAAGTSIFDEQPDSVGLVFASELGNFYTPGDSGMVDMINTMYDCPKEYKKSTQLRGTETIDKLFFSMIAGTTPSWLKTHMPYATMIMGLSSRMDCLYVEEQEFYVHLPEVDKTEDELLKSEIVKELNILGTLKGEIQITEEVSKRLKVMHREIQDSLYLEYFSRQYTKVIKYAILNSVIKRHSLTLDLSDIEEAYKLQEDLRGDSLKILDLCKTDAYSEAAALRTKRFKEKLVNWTEANHLKVTFMKATNKYVLSVKEIVLHGLIFTHGVCSNAKDLQEFMTVLEIRKIYQKRNDLLLIDPLPLGLQINVEGKEFTGFSECNNS